MTESEVLLLVEEALWSLEGHRRNLDVENAALALEAASALLGTTTTTVEKSGSVTRKRKKRKKAPSVQKAFIRHELQGALPPRATSQGVHSTMTILSDDYSLGKLTYVGFNTMSNGLVCLNFLGMCPLHKRVHDGGARKWQVKQSPSDEFCIIKCWHSDTKFFKLSKMPIY